jgi:hypothetical protein
MSQEVRERFGAQGFKFEYLEKARATPLVGTHMTNQRRQDIVDMKVLLSKLDL